MRRGLLGVVYFKSNSLRLINHFDEGTDSVPGDGERTKKRFIWSQAREERELSFKLGSKIGGLIPVCSVQG